MEMEYATEFDVKYDYDVLGNKPVYIIHLSGKEGCLAIGNSKKKTCEIRGDTLEEVKKRCLEIRTNTQLSYDISENVSKELGIVTKPKIKQFNYEYKTERYIKKVK